MTGGAGRLESRRLQGANLHRAPLGTPTRPLPNTSFAHIQIVPKESLEIVKNDEPATDQAVYRKASYTEETLFEMAEKAKLRGTGLADSLATNKYGTTFAAKARAAELNAARARKVMKDVDTEDEEGSPSGSGPSMKFTKPKTKAKNWKPVNLADLPDVPEIPEVAFSYAHVTQSEEMSAPQLGFGTGYDLNHLNPANARAPAGGELEATSSSKMAFDLSPDSKKLLQMVNQYDPSEWDPDMPALEFPDNRSQRGASNDRESFQQLSRLASGMLKRPSIESRPSSGASLMLDDRMKQDETTTSQFDEQIRVTASPASAHSAPQMEKESVVSRPPTRPMAFLGNDCDPFTGPRQHQYGQGHPVDAIEETSLGSHQYPAVRGTMNYDFRFPRQRLGREHSSSSHGTLNGSISNQISIRQGFGPEIQIGENQVGKNTYGGLSKEDKKDMLKKHLASITGKNNGVPKHAESAPDSKPENLQPPTSNRTVLHDPLANKTDHGQTSTRCTSGQAEVELFLASEPLPWKERPVSIQTVTELASKYNHGAVDTPTMQQTMEALLPIRQVVTTSGNDDALSIRLADAENWFNTTSGNKPFLDPCLAQGYLATAAKVFADTKRRTQEPSNTWPDNFEATVVPELESCKDTDSSNLATGVMLPVLANLFSYTSVNIKAGGAELDYFGRYGRVPDWCVDQGVKGDRSFFGEDWGKPPNRVGRDPRYRPMLHDGRYTVFEDLGLGRRLR
ncbi:hypothetical protein MMC09_006506 [Bachmanniomyces sp. S44760]|nr:hypothetical protein [Bachmanniomyces sp. S44760]